MVTDTTEFFARLDHCQAERELLSNEIRSYAQSGIESMVVDVPHSKIPHYDFLVKLNQPVPVSVRIRIGTIINETRVILDNLASVLAGRNGYTGSTTVYFPISKSKDVFDTDGKKKMRQLSSEDQEKIESLKPYKGGNEWLYCLHETDVERKHLKLAAKSAMMGGFVSKMPSHSSRAEQAMAAGAPIFDFRNADLTGEFVKIAEFTDLEMQPQDMDVVIAFTAPDLIRGANALSVLDKFNSVAREVVSLF